MSQGALSDIRTPAGWQWEPLGFMAPRVAEDGYGNLEPLSVYLGAGVVRRADREDNHNVLGADLDKYLRVLPGDLVFNKLRTWQGGLGASSYEGIVSPAYYVLRPDDRLDSRFVHYMLVSTPYLAELTRLSKFMPPSQFDMPWEALKRLPVLLPPVEEQRRIADFLDDQVARIDQLIALRRLQADLLDEQFRVKHDRLILGHDGVTLQATRWWPFEGTRSGWSEAQLRNIQCVVETGPFGSQLHADEYVDDGWPVINPASIQSGRLVPIPGVSVSDETRSRLARHTLQEGDVVFGRRGELGRAAVVSSDETGWICGTGSLRVRIVDPHLLPEYLYRLLSTAALRYYFDIQSVGSTMANLNTSILLAMPLLIPPVDEQGLLVETCGQLELEHAEELAATRTAIELLEERKRAVITAAVTGELDVTTARPIGVGKWVSNVGASGDRCSTSRSQGISVGALT